MRSRFLKIFIVTLSIATLFTSWCSTYAFAVDPISTGMALASAIDAYGMAYGIGSIYDVSDVNGVVQSFDGLWDEFAQYQSSNGDSYNYQNFYNNFDDSPSIQAFSHSSGKFAGFYIDSESAEVFDKFWTWLLTGPAEMVRVDNQFQWNVDSQTGEIITPVVSALNNSNIIEVPIVNSAYYNNSEESYNAGYTIGIGNNGNNTYRICTPTSQSNVYAFLWGSAGNYHVQFLGLTSSLTGSLALYNSSRRFYSGTLNQSLNVNDNGLYYVDLSISAFSTPSVYVFSLPDDGRAYFRQFIANPSDYYSTVSVKPYDVNDSTISLPDITNPDYEPIEKEIITNIPWDETYDDSDEDENGHPIPFPPSSVTPIIDDMIDSIIDDGFAITDDPQPNPDPEPSPNEVFLPFIPVGLPSFNFSFSGIWHYVREWVSSLSAWITTLFSIWSILPYAMVVPVYATAVVVIVLGVYKRFFM